MPNHITAQQLRPLMEEHPAAMHQLAKALGLQYPQLRFEAENGRLDAEHVLALAIASLDMLVRADAGQRVIDVDPDGVALRLAVQHRLLLEVSQDGAEARADAYSGHHYTALVDKDPAAAMREAIYGCITSTRG